MSTPRSGFRRAAATSWTLAGLGIAGVAGASALAYADTVKRAEALVPADAVELPAVPEAAPVNVPAAPVVPPPAVELPAPTVEAPAPVVAPQPVYVPQQAPVQPVYTPPKPVYQTPVQQAPVQQAPVQQAPAQPAFPIRTSHVPAGGSRSTGGNSFSPPVTRARGS
jgi:hypothetical protein